ncbi:MAG: hypothetical protein Q8T09_05050 [Candidatus Melainabacteria bacterium]|nr:hypothetical protein [Candidatus Melainabacteria bacterium]
MVNLIQNLALALTILCCYVAPALAEGEAKTREDEININDYRILNTADPGLAQDAAPAKAPKERAKISLKPSQTKAPQRTTGRNLLAAPMAVGGALMGISAGLTIGVPVRIARDISHETLRMRDQMTDDVAGSDKPDLFARTVGSYTGMAYGVVSGVIKGSIKGTERAIDCGARKPFSRESLSLQDPN